MFKTLTRQEALALKEFLEGIAAVDNSSEVQTMLSDLTMYLDLEQQAHDGKIASASRDPDQSWDQIFDLGEALEKLATTASPLFKHGPQV